VDELDLHTCYHAAFQAGDAKFYLRQTDLERKQYFQTLRYEEAKAEPGSSVILKRKHSVAFTYLLPYGVGNCHISCMCVHPDYQRQGLGTFMLHYAMREAKMKGMKSITLGTETGMVAYHFYLQHGFEVVDTGTSERVNRKQGIT
jgi:ribosomal protein S18 acetylase RimI-like enzyme